MNSTGFAFLLADVCLDLNEVAKFLPNSSTFILHVTGSI
jgi:hypothetical protein